MRPPFLSLSIVVSTLLLDARSQVSERQWHTAGAARWSALTLPSQGKIGFTLLPPEKTGVLFTNRLDELSSAANRVLENGSGVAIGDFDNDDRPDIFLCSLKGRNALYRNLGDWRFEKVSAAKPADMENVISSGAVFADVNGDSWLDLLVSTMGRGVLCFLNDGKGAFNDFTDSAGTRSAYGATTLALADVDGNGTLDLYVANYRTSDIRDQGRIDVRRINGRVTVAPRLRERIVLTPQGLLEFGDPDVLYLNDGNGRFSPVPWTEGAFLNEAGSALGAAPRDWGLSATFRDINGDGAPDLYVCNDFWTPDRIWINNGAGGFRPIDRLSIRHTSENSMGLDFADIDRDGHVDFLVVDMLSRDAAPRKRQALAQTRMPAQPGDGGNRPQYMRNMLFRARGDGTFEEIANLAGLSASDWSWQPLFIDVDLDGYEDVILTAGHRNDVQDLDATARIQSLQHSWPKGMDRKTQQTAFTREMMKHARLYPGRESPIIAFRNLGNLRFEETTQSWGTAAAGVHQGLGCGDLDDDGDLDLVVNNLNSVCGIYRNETSAPRVAVRLNGLAPNRQGIGARVKLVGGPVANQVQEMTSGGKYLSGCEALLVFAPGNDQNDMAIEVQWRSGRITTVPNVRANRLYEVTELEP